jgi:beta-phosphoglucomutase-like phosphatase (HAD superfamily)
MYSLKAIIFDFDGVLADTESLHYRMFERVLKDRI